MEHNNTSAGTMGPYTSISALVGLGVAEITKFDVFLHGLASLFTAVAAILSIYFTIKERSAYNKKKQK